MSKGVDIAIDALVTQFTSKLWTSKVRQFFGKISIINGKPVYYNNNVAVDPLKDDRKDAQCFFDVLNNKMFTDVSESEVRVMFMVNLYRLYPALSRNEAIEQVIEDVKTEIVYSQFEFIKAVRGVEALGDYGENTDIENHYLFRFDLKLIHL